MCLISIAWKMHDQFPLAIAANRDEFTARKSQALHQWQDSKIIAGRDVLAGGTWMGFHPNGRFAMLTNIRHPDYFKPNIHSRGALIVQLLTHDADLEDGLAKLQTDYQRYSGFNLLVGDADSLFHFNSATGQMRHLPAGVYGVSNADLDDPWPKVTLAKTQMDDWLARPVFDQLVGLHSDTQIAADADLPQTGISLTHERALSPQKIVLPDYATQVQTAAVVDAKGRLSLCEHNALNGHRQHFTMADFWPRVARGATVLE